MHRMFEICKRVFATSKNDMNDMNDMKKQPKKKVSITDTIMAVLVCNMLSN